jgi:hypothetical protein
VVTDRRDPPPIELDEAQAARSSAARSFARLIDPTTARHLADSRLTAVILVSLLMLLAVVAAIRFWLIPETTRWLHQRAVYQVAFRDIALEPPPPPWIRSGRAGLLERVRVGSGLPETLSLLDLKLEHLSRAFRNHCPWVGAVRGVRRAYPGSKQPALTVELEYRRPVARVRVPGQRPIILDALGVIVPADDLDLSATGPLFWITSLEPPLKLEPGVYWMSGPAPDGLAQPNPSAEAAARLAAFLQGKLTSAGTPASKLDLRIDVEHGPNHLFIPTTDGLWVHWADAPGAEPPGTPSAEQKWHFLLTWLQNSGPASVRDRVHQYLTFTPTGARVEHSPEPRPTAKDLPPQTNPY